MVSFKDTFLATLEGYLVLIFQLLDRVIAALGMESRGNRRFQYLVSIEKTIGIGVSKVAHLSTD
jgi:hypothetical protein